MSLYLCCRWYVCVIVASTAKVIFEQRPIDVVSQPGSNLDFTVSRQKRSALPRRLIFNKVCNREIILGIKKRLLIKIFI